MTIPHGLDKELTGGSRDIWQDSESISAYLQTMSRKYCVSNMSYIALKLDPLTASGPYYVTAYFEDWKCNYLTKQYISIDPAIRRSLESLLPFDQQFLDNGDASSRELAADAIEFGLGNQGLTFPLHGPRGEFAVFNVNSHAEGSEWQRIKLSHWSVFHVIACFVHDSLVQKYCGKNRAELTFREIECLRWASCGKTAWETGIIIGVSEKTVLYFLEQARVKLSATNKVQAVAVALRMGII